MSEEVKIKISQPMFEVGELERFDSNIHSIVEEYSKMMFKEKDQILTQRIIMKQEEEIRKLQNKVEELMTLYTTEREVKDDYKAIINKVISHIDIKIARALNEEDYNIDTDDLVDLRSELIGK